MAELSARFLQPSDSMEEGEIHKHITALPPKIDGGLGERHKSTETRLRRQGFQPSLSSRSNFAVKSIRRGSDDWLNMIKPFVSDLAHRSLVRRRFQSEISFRTYTCHAAVLFIDLSSYSKITAEISYRGAHALSSIVNAYLSRLLRISHNYGGDVVKFAGDAVVIVWEGNEQELGINVLTAAQCVIEMQEKAGSHPVEGTSLAFQIHCGLACGRLESEIFEAPTSANMQRLYHCVSGETMADISELVDLAAAGQVCISNKCVEYIGSRGTYGKVPGCTANHQLLTSIQLEPSLLDKMDSYIEKRLSEKLTQRDTHIEESFIHPSILRLLSHGGRSPTHIAQMRNLCILFVAMTSNASWINWLMEVQQVLDRNRCPIIQIIDDDKGVHIIAAINLYEAIPESNVLGVQVCRELVDKQVGCAIGMAVGSTFCGVTGSNEVACRWDVTGPPAVRAARLMQYALANDIDAAIDHSVYGDSMAAARLKLLRNDVRIKGNSNAIPIYGLSSASDYSAFRVLETVNASCHDHIVRDIQAYINGIESRCALIVTGPPQSGKKIACQRAAGFADLVPYLHVAEQTAGLLQLGKTLAVWFKYIRDDEIQFMARKVLENLDLQRWSKAHDQCVELVNITLQKGHRSCFLVDRIQFLDEFSFSLLRECLHGASRHARRSSSLTNRNQGNPINPKETGKISFLGVHVSLYNWMSAPDVVEHITRKDDRLRIPIMIIGQAEREELRTMFRDLSDMEVEDRWLDTYSKASGYCAGYFIERSAAMRKLSGKLWREGKRSLAETSQELVLYIPNGGCIRRSFEFSVMEISADVAMRFTQLYDELPPLFQAVCKIITIATRNRFYRLPRKILWEVVNDLIAEGVDSMVLDTVLDEMTDMHLLSKDSEEVLLSFQCPALGDIAYDVCTPVQIRSIAMALIDRLEAITSKDFMVHLVLGNLYSIIKEHEPIQKSLWLKAYAAFLDESRNWPEDKVYWWKEHFEDEVEDAGYDTRDILGDDFGFPRVTRKPIDHHLPLLKIYSAPVTFGPMGHSLSVLTRNTFHEYGVFHGARRSTTCRLLRSSASASNRYLNEIECVEEFLGRYKLMSTEVLLEEERAFIRYLAEPAKSDEEVTLKAVRILDDYIPKFVQGRMNRLYSLIAELRKEGTPDVIKNGPGAIYRAYEALQAPKNRNDAAQDALMILATMNFKPQPVPEFLPLLHYQTVARIRNKVLRRLSESERFIFIHQQSIDDLEAFLVVTPLLYAAQQSGKCICG